MNELTAQEIKQRFEGFFILKPKYEKLWLIIDEFDKKHIEKNYPYQTSEVKMILRITYGLLANTTETKYNVRYLNEIRKVCEAIRPENPDFRQIDELKDLIHRLCVYGFPNAKVNSETTNAN